MATRTDQLDVGVAFPDQAGQENLVPRIGAHQGDVAGLSLSHGRDEVAQDQLVEGGGDQRGVRPDCLALAPLLVPFCRGKGEVPAGAGQTLGFQTGELLLAVRGPQLRDVDREGDPDEVRRTAVLPAGGVLVGLSPPLLGVDPGLVSGELTEARVGLPEHDDRSRATARGRMGGVRQVLVDVSEDHRVGDHGRLKDLLPSSHFWLGPRPFDEVLVGKTGGTAANHLDPGGSRLSAGLVVYCRAGLLQGIVQRRCGAGEIGPDNSNPVPLVLVCRTPQDDLDGIGEGGLVNAGRGGLAHQQQGQHLVGCRRVSGERMAEEDETGKGLMSPRIGLLLRGARLPGQPGPVDDVVIHLQGSLQSFQHLVEQIGEAGINGVGHGCNQKTEALVLQILTLRPGQPGRNVRDSQDVPDEFHGGRLWSRSNACIIPDRLERPGRRITNREQGEGRRFFLPLMFGTGRLGLESEEAGRQGGHAENDQTGLAHSILGSREEARFPGRDVRPMGSRPQ